MKEVVTATETAAAAAVAVAASLASTAPVAATAVEPAVSKESYLLYTNRRHASTLLIAARRCSSLHTLVQNTATELSFEMVCSGL